MKKTYKKLDQAKKDFAHYIKEANYWGQKIKEWKGSDKTPISEFKINFLFYFNMAKGQIDLIQIYERFSTRQAKKYSTPRRIKRLHQIGRKGKNGRIFFSIWFKSNF